MNRVFKRHQSRLVGIVVLFVILIALSGHFKFQDLLKQKPQLFDVVLKVDFGPAKKPVYQGTLQVEKETTANEAVSRIFPIRSGMSCCSFRELVEVDGVAIDPAKNRWWICLINGSRKGFTPHRSTLKAGDVVEWKFVEDSQ